MVVQSNRIYIYIFKLDFGVLGEVGIVRTGESWKFLVSHLHDIRLLRPPPPIRQFSFLTLFSPPFAILINLHT